MTDLFGQPDDATPLDAEEREGLLQTWITTRADLNEAEQANIDAAVAWTTRRRATEILTEGFVFELHKRKALMPGKVVPSYVLEDSFAQILPLFEVQ